MGEFSGAKMAVICGDRLIAYKRDNKPGIPFPGLWDLPGGGREGDETPVECALRELAEEFAIRLPAERVHWCRAYGAAYFLATEILPDEVKCICFGDEGERWEMMLIDTFLQHPESAPHLQSRLRDYLDARSG